MCLDLKKKSYVKTIGHGYRLKGHPNNAHILCTKEMLLRGEKSLVSRFRTEPAKIGKWAEDSSRSVLRTDQSFEKYVTGFHAYIVDKIRSSISGIKFTIKSSKCKGDIVIRLAIISSITTIGVQNRRPVAVGRRQYIVPRKEEDAVLKRFAKRLKLIP